MTCLCQVVRWNEIGRDENVVNSYPHHYSHDVLYWSLLYCTVLHCTVLYCIVFHFRIPRMYHLHFSLVHPSIHSLATPFVTSLHSHPVLSAPVLTPALLSSLFLYLLLHLTSSHSISPPSTRLHLPSPHLFSLQLISFRLTHIEGGWRGDGNRERNRVIRSIPYRQGGLRGLSSL